MEIIDSKEAKIKKIIIVIVIVTVAVAAVIITAWLATRESNQINNEKIEVPNGFKDALVGEKPTFDLEGCLKNFSGLDKMSTEDVKLKQKEIVEMDIGKASDYYLCLSIKNNNSQYCDALNTSADALKSCKSGFIKYTKTIFPALKANQCDAQSIDACKSTGTDNCESSCRGLILKEMAECDNLSNNYVEKNMCLAINNDDVSICNSMNESDRKNCTEVFYFFKAAREKNASYIDKIEDVDFRPIAQLYFDPETRCEKILAGFGEYSCDEKYSRHLLETPEIKGDEPQKN